MFIYILPVLFMMFYMGKNAYDEKNKFSTENGYVAQVSITGTIELGSGTASADAVIPPLRAAFADPAAKGVLVRISTPGGSPTQSLMIYDEMKRLQEAYPDKKMLVIGEEYMTSGGYYIASAAPKIYGMDHTYIGSIGVIVSRFDFSKVAEKLDVGRLVITSGKSKSQLDQFLPPKEKDIEKVRNIANQIHAKFIDVVEDSRGERLQGERDSLFSGDYWLGEEAMKLGLIDEVITAPRLLMREFGTEVVRDFSRKPGFFESMKSGLVKHAAGIMLGLTDQEIDALHSAQVSQSYPITMQAPVLSVQ